MQRTDAMVMISLHPKPRKYESLGTENTGPSSCLGKLKIRGCIHPSTADCEELPDVSFCEILLRDVYNSRC